MSGGQAQSRNASDLGRGGTLTIVAGFPLSEFGAGKASAVGVEGDEKLIGPADEVYAEIDLGDAATG